MSLRNLFGKGNEPTTPELENECFSAADEVNYSEPLKFILKEMDAPALSKAMFQIAFLRYIGAITKEDLETMLKTGVVELTLIGGEANADVEEGYDRNGSFYLANDVSVEDANVLKYIVRYKEGQHCEHLEPLHGKEFPEDRLLALKQYRAEVSKLVKYYQPGWDSTTLEAVHKKIEKINLYTQKIAEMGDAERSAFYDDVEQTEDGVKGAFRLCREISLQALDNAYCFMGYLRNNLKEKKLRKLVWKPGEAAKIIIKILSMTDQWEEALKIAEANYKEKLKAAEENQKRAQEELEAQENGSKPKGDGNKDQSKGDGNKAQKQMPIVAKIVQGIIDAIKGHGYELPHKLTLYDGTGATIQDLTLLSILEENKMLHLITLEDLGKIVTWRNERNLDVEPLYHFQDAWKAECKARAEADSNNDNNQ